MSLMDKQKDNRHNRLLHGMRPRAILRRHSNSYPFDERAIDLTQLVKVGRAVAKCKPQCDNAIFDCKVLSRNHAVIWFDSGKFYIRDTCSSNGTFINNTRLSPANEDSPGKEIHSNDVIQFGVEVVDSASKMTHGCIILKIKLFYPNGVEASKTATMFNIPTANLLPPYYSYTQMLEREQLIYEKLGSIEDILKDAHTLADMTLKAKKEKENLLQQLEELQITCDETSKLSQKLQKEIDTLDKSLTKQEAISIAHLRKIQLLDDQILEKDKEVQKLQKMLDNMIRQDHRFATPLFLLLIIMIVAVGFNVIV